MVRVVLMKATQRNICQRTLSHLFGPVFLELREAKAEGSIWYNYRFRIVTRFKSVVTPNNRCNFSRCLQWNSSDKRKGCVPYAVRSNHGYTIIFSTLLHIIFVELLFFQTFEKLCKSKMAVFWRYFEISSGYRKSRIYLSESTHFFAEVFQIISRFGLGAL